METIKNYLETMFASMPNTPEVRKAKDELLSMMEDKYNEMIEEGINENTAVGTVISEFGNLDELAEDLGLTKEIEEVKERDTKKRKFVSFDEIQQYINCESRCALLIAIGVFLCITSVAHPNIWDNYNEPIGIICMFISIGIAVALFVYSGICRADWSFLQKEPCTIDFTTADAVKNQRRSFKNTKAMCITIGVILCVISFVPAAIFDNAFTESLLFVFVGIGVFLMVYANTIANSYDTVLRINDEKTLSGYYSREEDVKYISKKAEAIMSVYWSTVVCIYLTISFVTMCWHISWLIFPVAAILRKVLKTAWAEEEE